MSSSHCPFHQVTALESSIRKISRKINSPRVFQANWKLFKLRTIAAQKTVEFVCCAFFRYMPVLERFNVYDVYRCSLLSQSQALKRNSTFSLKSLRNRITIIKSVNNGPNNWLKKDFYELFTLVRRHQPNHHDFIQK